MLIISPKTRRRHALTRRGLLTGAAALSMIDGLKLSDAQAQSACGSFYPTPPAPAAAAGFNNLVFSDDFDVAGTIGPGTTSDGSGNFNFWLWNQCNNTLGTGASSTANVVLLPTQTAAGVSNGNSGGGSFASANGGILQLNGPACGSGNITVASQQNAFYGGYIEAYLQFNPNLNVNGNWIAWWMNARNRIPFGGFSQIWTELDIVEVYDGNFGFPASGAYASCKQWGANGSNSVAGAGQYIVPNGSANFVQDSNWHKFGFRWQVDGGLSAGPNTTATGTISFWIDDLQMVTWNNGNPKTSYRSGPGGDPGAQYMNFSVQPLYLGGPFGAGANMNVDYVRVWQ